MSAINYSGNIERLISIMDDLRLQCPWDKKQTIQTLRQLSIEEVYELADAIDANDWVGVEEELGDLLLHIIFYIKIGTEQQQLSLHSVIEKICNKLVHRHPHIYDKLEVENEDQVKQNWEKLKLKEGKKSLLAGVPKALPAMVKAIRIQEKSKQVGFEWETTAQVKLKVDEELQELQDELDAPEIDHQKVMEEFGDVLFSMVNYARFLNIDPEQALEMTNKKFMDRFNKMEQIVMLENKNMSEMTLEELDAVWNKVKKEGR